MLRDWRWWVCLAGMLAVAGVDLRQPTLIVLPFLWSPVVFSIAFAGWRGTGVLAIVGTILVVAVGSLSGYFSDINFIIRTTAMGCIAMSAVYLSYLFEKRSRTLQELATTDPLTGLPNRRLLLDRLDQLLRLRIRHSQIAVFAIDLDHFKSVNDSYGHPGGDKVLQEVARRFVGCIRDDETVARVGGDEFVIVCSSITSTSGAETVCKRLTRCFDEPFAMPMPPGFGATIGAVTVAKGNRPNAQSLINEADALLMKQKETKRGGYSVTATVMNRPTDSSAGRRHS
ncbi:MAG: GGDEF domain-containing protein [Actinobacteria bacterium]|nr:GGDEF domain-containing protein [Actinomycetota bacterium]